MQCTTEIIRYINMDGNAHCNETWFNSIILASFVLFFSLQKQSIVAFSCVKDMFTTFFFNLISAVNAINTFHEHPTCLKYVRYTLYTKYIHIYIYIYISKRNPPRQQVKLPLWSPSNFKPNKASDPSNGEFHISEALMPSMMVRYAGPKVFVALQETEGIHDEGGTGARF